jgi:hypothetical protein
MFLHTNGENKDIDSHIPPDSGLDSAKNDLSPEVYYKLMLGNKYL